MAKTTENTKKESKITRGIIIMILGLLALIFGADYLWVLFGVIELPLQLVGGVFLAIGLVFLLLGIREKKKEEQEAE